jgi:hypothetical protein
LYKWPKKGLNVIIALAVISTIARYYVTYAYELSNYVSFGIRFVANNSLFWLHFKFTPLFSSSSSV